ncbi:MAG: hypothetical protein WB999_18395 [Candidatus Binataceae bacterium]
MLAFRQGAREHKPAAWIYIASPAIFFRYNIIDEGDPIDGGEKLAAYFAKSQPTEQKVVQLKTGTE